MNISILILNYNRLQETIDCIQNCLEQDFDNYDIHVLDNGSTDNSYDILSYTFTNINNIKLYRSDYNLGCIGGRNYLSNYITSKYIFFCDNDGLLNNTALKNAFQIINSDKNIGVVSGIVIDKKLMSNYNPDSNDVKNVYNFQGGVCLIDTLLYKNLGKFPENFIYGGEETFFTYKLLNINYKVVSCSSIILYHEQSIKGRDINSNYKNLISNQLKNAYIFYTYELLLIYLVYFFFKYFYIIKPKEFFHTIRSFKSMKRTPLRREVLYKIFKNKYYIN